MVTKIIAYLCIPSLLITTILLSIMNEPTWTTVYFFLTVGYVTTIDTYYKCKGE